MSRFEKFRFFVVHRARFCRLGRLWRLRNFQGTAGFPIRNVIRPQNDSKMIFSNRLKFSEAIGRCIRYSKFEYKLRSPPITPVPREYRFSCLLSTIIWGSLHISSTSSTQKNCEITGTRFSMFKSPFAKCVSFFFDTAYPAS